MSINFIAAKTLNDLKISHCNVTESSL